MLQITARFQFGYRLAIRFPYLFLLISVFFFGCDTPAEIRSSTETANSDGKDTTSTSSDRQSKSSQGEYSVGTPSDRRDVLSEREKQSGVSRAGSSENGAVGIGRGIIPGGEWKPIKPIVTREEFAISIDVSALEYLQSKSSVDETRYLMVGKIDSSGPTVNSFEFASKYEQSKQYQIKVNGVRVIVPIGLVDTLHRATLYFDDESKKLEVKLATH